MGRRHMSKDDERQSRERNGQVLTLLRDAAAREAWCEYIRLTDPAASYVADLAYNAGIKDTVAIREVQLIVLAREPLDRATHCCDAQEPAQEEHGPGKLPPEVCKNLQEGGPAYTECGPAIGHVGGLKRANFE